MAHEPDKWDYAAAGVPSALTEEMELQQQAKQVGFECRAALLLMTRALCSLTTVHISWVTFSHTALLLAAVCAL